VADPVVLLVAPASSGGAALRDRLTALGFSCELVDATSQPRGWLEARGDVVLVLETGGFGSPASFILSRRSGTRIEGLPLIVLGQRPPRGEGGGPDEVIPADATDSALAERLRVWGRWASRAARQRDLEAQIDGLAESDALSGLPGHRAFQERLDLEVKRAMRYASPVGLLLGDIEGMRTVNERYGHRTGDRVLREVGQTLRRALREVDFVSRYEGNRFGIVLPESDAEATMKVGARLRSLVASLIFRGEAASSTPLPLMKVSILFGHASLPAVGLLGRTALFEAAEHALERERRARTSPVLPA
jgi:diguanylate cyclase (GGDEF)-like protein